MLVVLNLENEMPHDLHCTLWPSHDTRRFFPDLTLRHRRQLSTDCVPNALSVITGIEPAFVKRDINTQSPISWSDFLGGSGYQLAYCNTDFRRLQHYVAELLALDDLFLISTYGAVDPRAIGSEPDSAGWITSSHIAVLYRDTVYDSMLAGPCPLAEYGRLNRYVKRLFRVVPFGFSRSL